MRPRLKLYLTFLGILIFTAAAAFIVYPNGGSKIDLRKIKIPYYKEFDVKLGLDLQGGSHLAYKADFSNIAEADRAEALSAIRDTLERRVNSFGVSEPTVQVSGQDKIIVELPGIKDVNEAIRQIGQTPLLEFKLENPNPPSVTPDASGSITVNPDDQFINTGLSGKQIRKATAEVQTGSNAATFGNNVVVRLEFNDEGKKLFSEITSQNLGKRVAIFLDGQILSAPVVQNAITDGIAIISGSFTVEEARQLATRLNSGALPVPISLISQQNVGATLGQESIDKSILAGFIGLVLIALFMVMYYRFPGLLAVFALAIYTIVSLAVFKIGISIAAVFLVGIFFFLGITVSAWFGALSLVSYIVLLLLGGVQPVTLTLAGIAGFILSIGMAVDANILIFERIREEIRAGKDIGKAVEDGFARAWLSIRDSNVSSLITTGILYMFGTPSIKGFAITLGIGILISMFTAITITRTFLKLFITSNLLTHPWLFGVSRKRANN